MNKIKYDSTLIKCIPLFENITGAKLKDCISNKDNEQLIFIVKENEIAKAIGKNGSNAKKLGGLLNKKIKIVEFNSDIRQFIRNFIMPLQVKDIKDENNTVTIVGQDTKTKGMLIGRESKNLKDLKDVVGRYFKFEDIRVV